MLESYNMNHEFNFYIKLKVDLSSEEEANQMASHLKKIIPGAEVDFSPLPADERIERLAGKLREKFGLLPDETPISDVIPPFEWRKASRLSTRTKIRDRYPDWWEIYESADYQEKRALSRLSRLNYGLTAEKGIRTLGDIRKAPEFSLIERYFGAQSVQLAKLGFPPLQKAT